MTPPGLDQLRDIHLPPAPLLATVADAGGIGVAALLFLALIGGLAWRFSRRRRLRAALRELSRLAADHARDGDATRFVSGLSGLLRRYALGRFPEAGVAGLAGADWLAFLDAHGSGATFSEGAGAVLAWRPYRAQGEVDEAALIILVRRWLEANPS